MAFLPKTMAESNPLSKAQPPTTWQTTLEPTLEPPSRILWKSHSRWYLAIQPRLRIHTNRPCRTRPILGLMMLPQSRLRMFQTKRYRFLLPTRQTPPQMTASTRSEDAAGVGVVDSAEMVNIVDVEEVVADTVANTVVVNTEAVAVTVVVRDAVEVRAAGVADVAAHPVDHPQHRG